MFLITERHYSKHVFSHRAIGEYFNLDRATVIHSEKVINNLISTDKKFSHKYNFILMKLDINQIIIDNFKSAYIFAEGTIIVDSLAVYAELAYTANIDYDQQEDGYSGNAIANDVTVTIELARLANEDVISFVEGNEKLISEVKYLIENPNN